VNRKVEILAPAGNLEKLQIAVSFGANAVYCAGKNFGLRAFAGNFTMEELAAGIKFAHRHNAKVYVTVNIFAHNDDLTGLPEYLHQLARLKVDGIIVSDPGVIRIARTEIPRVPLHLSTQANTTNWSGAKFWQQQGIKRIVLARELSLAEIKEIRRKVSVDLEAFVHGAMCISYSGRCLLSNYMVGRDANRGECAQACRWKYYLTEAKRSGEYMEIEEDRRGAYILNSRDLCMLEYIPELVEAGINSFKIEGRMKSVHYVATVVRAYRLALDGYLADPEDYQLPRELLEEVQKVSHRGYTTGFYRHKPGAEDHNYLTSKYVREYDFVAMVKGYDRERGHLILEQRNNFQAGETLEVLPPRGEVEQLVVGRMLDGDGEEIAVARHPQQQVRICTPRQFPPFSLLRRSPKE